jgi:hypothetical protein
LRGRGFGGGVGLGDSGFAITSVGAMVAAAVGGGAVELGRTCGGWVGVRDDCESGCDAGGCGGLGAVGGLGLEAS